MKKKSIMGMVVGMVISLLVVPFVSLSIVNSESNNKIKTVESWQNDLIDDYLESIGFPVTPEPGQKVTVNKN